jgi:hypothetical protein
MCDCYLDATPIVDELKLHRPIIPAPGWRVFRVFLDREQEGGYDVCEYTPLGWQVQDDGDYKLVCVTQCTTFTAGNDRGDSCGYVYAGPTEKDPSPKELLSTAHNASAGFIQRRCRKNSSLREQVTAHLMQKNITIRWGQPEVTYCDFLRLTDEMLVELEEKVEL